MSTRRDTYIRPEFVWSGWHTAWAVSGLILVLAVVGLIVSVNR